MSAQMAAPHPARLVAVCEAALREFAAPPQYTLAVLAPHPPPIRIHRLLFGLLACPVPPPLLLLLRNVAAHAVRLHPFHHRTAVIPPWSVTVSSIPATFTVGASLGRNSASR